MTASRRKYTMYPQKTYGGYVETEVLQDGRIKYYLYLLGSDEPNEMVVDPCDENQMRAVRQLHLIMQKGKTDEPNYVIEGDDVESILESIRHMFRKVEGQELSKS